MSRCLERGVIPMALLRRNSTFATLPNRNSVDFLLKSNDGHEGVRAAQHHGRHREWQDMS